MPSAVQKRAIRTIPAIPAFIIPLGFVLVIVLRATTTRTGQQRACSPTAACSAAPAHGTIPQDHAVHAQWKTVPAPALATTARLLCSLWPAVCQQPVVMAHLSSEPLFLSATSRRSAWTELLHTRTHTVRSKRSTPRASTPAPDSHSKARACTSISAVHLPLTPRHAAAYGGCLPHTPL